MKLLVGKKNRGVIGSRTKLEAALAASDLPKKTQTALAEAIADYEALDAAPKDLVSKLFRELPVDPQTIERVARILKVDAFSLYRTEDEQELLFGNGNQHSRHPPTQDPSPKLKKYALLIVFGLTLFVTFGIIEIYKPFIPVNSCPDGLVGSGLTTPEKSLGIIISRFAGDEHNEAQIMLARFFAMDEKLANSIEVFTSCRRFDNSLGMSFKDTLQRDRKNALRDLEAIDAQIFVWGERYKNRLNLHFITRRNDEDVMTLRLEDKLVKAKENSFTLPVNMTADRPFPTSLKQIIFDIIYPETKDRISLKNKMTNSLHSSSNWLKEAIASGQNLLRTISPEKNPDLYVVTGGQLCYQYRLLGDVDNNDKQFEQAENFCRQVISHMSKKDDPYAWGVLHLNLASVMVRRHIFAKTAAERFNILDSARKTFEKVEGIFTPDNSPANFSAFHQNYGGVLLRLAEITSGKKSINYLQKAITSTKASLQILSPDKQPYRYAQTRQNLCVMKYRYAEKTREADILEGGIEDCQAAVDLLSPTKEAQAWGMAQNNLAAIYATLADIKKDPAIFQQALEEFSTAQQAYTYKDFPANWAEVEINKSELYCRLSILTQNPDLLPQSITHGEAALRIFTEKGIKRYAEYAEILLEKVRSCDPSNMNTCKCSD
ncbi:hypothetical protein MNBD_ALPHA02-2433 [hydrothermal vent metagenome]|uniref:Uncharacterized protein n=1 Tax=hydrothermal vent metagenome TaxID=652676 RepID=A0A3B0SCB9_9ZZZZ